MYNDINHTSFSWLPDGPQLLPAAGAKPFLNETRPSFVLPNDIVLKPAIHFLHAFHESILLCSGCEGILLSFLFLLSPVDGNGMFSVDLRLGPAVAVGNAARTASPR
tara:strand:+ start:1398 stop:1718 length:321 start_codon:yes stop_codon:yes gene_type:complete